MVKGFQIYCLCFQFELQSRKGTNELLYPPLLFWFKYLFFILFQYLVEHSTSNSKGHGFLIKSIPWNTLIALDKNFSLLKIKIFELQIWFVLAWLALFLKISSFLLNRRKELMQVEGELSL